MVSKNAEEFWCEPECLKDPERLDLRRDVQNVGRSQKKIKAVLWRRPLIEVLVADFDSVLLVVGAADLSLLR